MQGESQGPARWIAVTGQGRHYLAAAEAPAMEWIRLFDVAH